MKNFALLVLLANLALSQTTYLVTQLRLTINNIRSTNSYVIALSEVRFYSNASTLVPVAAVTCPNGNWMVGEEPSKLVDGIYTNRFADRYLNYSRPGGGGMINTQLVFQLAGPQFVNSYDLYTAYSGIDNSGDPTAWIIEGMLDNSSWSRLDSRSGQSPPVARGMSYGVSFFGYTPGGGGGSDRGSDSTISSAAIEKMIIIILVVVLCGCGIIFGGLCYCCPALFGTCSCLASCLGRKNPEPAVAQGYPAQTYPVNNGYQPYPAQPYPPQPYPPQPYPQQQLQGYPPQQQGYPLQQGYPPQQGYLPQQPGFAPPGPAGFQPGGVASAPPAV